MSAAIRLASILTLAVSLAIWEAGCDRVPALTSSGKSVRDSADITVIVYDSTAVKAVPMWEVGAVPLTRYGVRDDANDNLFRVVDAEFVGINIAIADAGNARVKLYSRRGDIVRLHGSSGVGPGEYRSIVGLQRRGDTLLVLDARNSRVTFLDSAMDVVQTQPITLPSRTRVARVVGVLDDGRLIVGESVMLSPDAVGQVALEFPLYRIGPSDSNELGRFALAPRFITRSEAGTGIRTVPIYASPSFVVSGQHVYFAGGQSPEVRILNGTGVIEAILRWGIPPPRVTDLDLEQLLADRLSAMDHEAARQRETRRFDEMVLPESWPAIQSLTTDADGRVWVRLHAPPEGVLQDWLVIDGEEIVGRVVLPVESNVLTAVADEIVLRVVDEMEVERVELRQLRIEN